ncbi:YihY/virulence factor BrkB family protein [Phytoactinopolyspora halophila]|uniref:YihY/virulence factor BrkB family protein n=1 Tax=Phytoactinopolyspora halophila TaxID=1981511 RepID=UPI001313DBA5|nr:YhjD/YihY/BrkB family envelope integrity protein [Phytoactinopolyspora halophila]
MNARLRALWSRARALWVRARALWKWLQPTLPVRAWKRYGNLRGDRLAGAASFYGFFSLFPLLLLASAVASRVAGRAGVETVQQVVDDNFPEIGLDVARFYENAGTVGVVSAIVLIYTGLRWVDSIRAAVRSMWGMDDKPGNIITRKLFDLVALIGLGLLLAVSWGMSVVARHMTQQLLEWFGVEGVDATGVLGVVSWVLSIGVNTLLFAYLLTGLPRIIVPAKEQALTALLGAVVFEILKNFLVQYVLGPGADDTFAAFAAPLALIAWIYVVTRLLMVLAALTAESAIDHLDAEQRDKALAHDSHGGT